MEEAFLSNPTNCLIIGASFLTAFLINGVYRISGLLFVACIRRYEITREQASMPFIFAFTVRSLSGPLVGYLGVKFGLRAVTVAGCLLSSIGIGACFFAEDVIAITVLWGGMFGLGFGMGGYLVPQILSQYFTKHFDKASGIYLAGAGLGAIILPFLGDLLLKTYGISGTFLILSGVVMHGVPASMLLRSPRLKTKLKTDAKCIDSDKKIANTNSSFLQYSVLKSNNKCPNKDSANCNADTSNPTRPSNKVKDPESFLRHTQPKREGKSYTNMKTQISEKSYEQSDCIVTKGCQGTKNMRNIQNSEKSSKQSSKPIPQKREQEFSKGEISVTSGDNSINPVSKINSQETVQVQTDGNNFSSSTLITDFKVSTILKKCEDSRPLEFQKKKISATRNFRVFLDPAFILILVTQSLTMFINTTIWTVIVDASSDSGVAEHEEVQVLMAIAITDMFGRIFLGYITDKGYITKINFSTCCFVSLGILFASFVWVKGFPMVMLVVCLCGLFIGGQLMIMFGIVNQYIEKEDRTMAFSSRFFLHAPISFSQPSIIGFFKETLQSYDGLFYFLTSTCLLCGILTLSIPPTARFRDRRKERVKATED